MRIIAIGACGIACAAPHVIGKQHCNSTSCGTLKGTRGGKNPTVPVHSTCTSTGQFYKDILDLVIGRIQLHAWSHARCPCRTRDGVGVLTLTETTSNSAYLSAPALTQIYYRRRPSLLPSCTPVANFFLMDEFFSDVGNLRSATVG